MSQVSRPMQIALLATVLIAVVWLVALRPKPAGVGGTAGASATPAQQTPSAPGTDGLKRAVDEAHAAAGTAAATLTEGTAGAERTGASGTAGTGSATPAAEASAPTRATPHASPHRLPTDPNVRLVRSALRQHKAIAIAFVTPKVSDARAVAEEMRHVGRFGGRAVVLSVPLGQLSRYGFITRGVDVTVAPTVVIVARNRQATTIVGFADRFEIEQRLADALAVKR